MDDLTAFVTARLDEDEAIANAAASEAGPDWTWDRESRDGYLRTPAGTIMADALNVEDEQFRPHVARHDPARALREVAAKRAILAEHGHYRVDHNWTGRTDLDAPFGCSTCHIGNDGDMYDGGWCVTVRQLAAIYSDHPGYRPEWAPEGAPDGT